jgi:hypothetical protein
LVGEEDFKKSDNYTKIVKELKELLEGITHTNIIIALPTYICGAPLYNYRVEMFNVLMLTSMQHLENVHVFDCNYDLTFDLFSSRTGKVTNLGLKNVFENLSRAFFR